MNHVDSDKEILPRAGLVSSRDLVVGQLMAGRTTEPWNHCCAQEKHRREKKERKNPAFKTNRFLVDKNIFFG